MVVDYKSNDCILMITDMEFEYIAKMAMSYLLNYTDFKIADR